MPPADRLQFARLIFDDLAPTDAAVDIGDAWTDDDLADLTAYAARHAHRPNTANENPA